MQRRQLAHAQTPQVPSDGGARQLEALGDLERGLVDDYLAFGQMMLNGGRLGNQRILSRLSVETMTTDQLTPEGGEPWHQLSDHLPVLVEFEI